MSVEAQVAGLRKKANQFASADGVAIVSAIEANSSLVLQWVTYLSRHKTNSADELLGGVASSLVEAAACAALGLVRPALFSMRTEIDVLLTWLYFKDHPVEWENVNATGDGFKLKKELFEYFARYFDGFSSRYGILGQIIRRKDSDTYRFLSAHIHSQSTVTLPLACNLDDVVRDRKTGDELALIAKDVDEYISDVLLAIFARDWVHLPDDIMNSLNSRFKSKAQKKEFFKGI
ncbi:hypothetical protein ISG25_18525 [Burkholderia pseudomallei]|nr:hypothetical protein [Burkholderia pseudomallei]MBF3724561.1 hypothetical protein [Burkholderia pseudomallei]